MKNYIIKTDGTKVNIEPKNGVRFTLEELQSAVGGYIEIINLNNDSVLVVNENGKLYNLELNKTATVIAHYHRAIFASDYIVGDVVRMSNNMLD